MKLVAHLADWFNRLPLWRGECLVWGQRMVSATFDRWLYLRLHRHGRMGRDERRTLGRLVRPGMTVLDVGANLGLYTVLLSRLVGASGRVISFEPDPSLHALAQRSCILNACTNVTLYNLALGSRRDRLQLKKTPFNSGDNHLAAGGSDAFRQTISVEVVALDEFAPHLRPDFVKIDVQGWELEVMRGIKSLLSAPTKIQVLFEFWPAGFRRAGHAPADLIEFISANGLILRYPSNSALVTPAALAGLIAKLSGLKHIDLLATND